MNNNIVIAIDGPSASGKTTNAKRVAHALGFIHVDTGAMFRTLAWYCLKMGADPHDRQAVEKVCESWNAKLECSHNTIRLLVDGHFPEKEIRAREVSEATPLIAASPKVRHWMKETQRRCLEFGSLVMEGRDIGAHIFPEAQFKFYLDATLTERARRRQAEGNQEDIAARDQHDTRRTAAPLKIAKDATIIDNSKLTPDETTALILDRVKKEMASV